jgi:hypothetical protein
MFSLQNVVMNVEGPVLVLGHCHSPLRVLPSVVASLLLPAAKTEAPPLVERAVVIALDDPAPFEKLKGKIALQIISVVAGTLAASSSSSSSSSLTSSSVAVGNQPAAASGSHPTASSGLPPLENGNADAFSKTICASPAEVLRLVSETDCVSPQIIVEGAQLLALSWGAAAFLAFAHSLALLSPTVFLYEEGYSAPLDAEVVQTLMSMCSGGIVRVSPLITGYSEEMDGQIEVNGDGNWNGFALRQNGTIAWLSARP